MVCEFVYKEGKVFLCVQGRKGVFVYREDGVCGCV